MQGTSHMDQMQNMINKDYIDFDEKNADGSYKWASKEGLVDIVPIKQYKHKEPNFQFKSYQVNGVTYGIPLKINPIDNTFIFKAIRITGARQFDLSNRADREEYIMISNWHQCKQSPNQRGRALVGIYDRGLEARQNIDKFKLSKEARRIAEDLAFESDQINDMYGMARLMGIEPKNESDDVIRERILMYSTENPTEFLAKWQDESTRNITITIKRGLATGLIQKTMDRGYTYNSVPVGSTEMSMINHFRENPDVLTALDIESKRKDEKYVKVASIESIEVKPEVIAQVRSEDKDQLLKYQAMAAKKGYKKSEWESLNLKALENYLQDKSIG